MKVGYWNCRGIGRHSLWTEIDSFCKIENIQIIAIGETKTDWEPSDQVWRRAGFDNMVWIPAIGKARGLMVLWKEHQMVNEEVKVVLKDTRIVAIQCKTQSTEYRLCHIFCLCPNKSTWQTRILGNS